MRTAKEEFIEKSAMTAHATFMAFGSVGNWLENRGVSIDEFNRIKQIHRDMVEFGTGFYDIFATQANFSYEFHHLGDTRISPRFPYHKNHVFWIARAFEEEDVNLKIGLRAVEIQDMPQFKHLAVFVRFDNWSFWDFDDGKHKPRLMKSARPFELVLKLFVNRYVGEKIEIVQLLTDSFMELVEGYYRFHDDEAKKDDLSKKISLIFSNLNCNKPPAPPEIA